MRTVIFGSVPGSGNDRFLTGVCAELAARECAAVLHPPHGPAELEQTLAGADVVIVHDATTPEILERIRRHHAGSDDYLLLFYDTHQRQASAPPHLRRFNLAGFDGVLATGEVITESYLERGWESRAFTWREAADAYRFAPHPGVSRNADLVWLGDRHDLGVSHELGALLLEPARRLGLSGVIHGERYPWRARLAIQRSGLRYGGPLAEHLTATVWARHRFTAVLPTERRMPPGVPPTRMFEALAAGIPLICTPWEDSEGLFTAGRDYLPARDQREFQAAMRNLRNDRAMAAELAQNGRATVLARHTCAHRVDQLLSIVTRLRSRSGPDPAALAAPSRARLYGFSRRGGPVDGPPPARAIGRAGVAGS